MELQARTICHPVRHNASLWYLLSAGSLKCCMLLASVFYTSGLSAPQSLLACSTLGCYGLVWRQRVCLHGKRWCNTLQNQYWYREQLWHWGDRGFYCLPQGIRAYLEHWGDCWMASRWNDSQRFLEHSISITHDYVFSKRCGLEECLNRTQELPTRP